MFRFTYAIAYGLFALALSYVAFALTGLAVFWIYEALVEWFPSAVPSYSPVLEADKYGTIAKALSVIGAISAVFLATLLATRFDNGRDEFIIRRTEGFYRLPEIMPTYYKAYALPDLVASFVNTAVISALLIPAGLAEFEEVSAFSNAVYSFRDLHLGVFYGGINPIISILAVLALFYVSKLVAGIWALKKWRAAWLAYN